MIIAASIAIWIKIHDPFYDYEIFTDGTFVYSMNQRTMIIDFMGTNASQVIQSSLDAVPKKDGVSIFIDKGLYKITAPIILNKCDQYITSNTEYDTNLQAQGNFRAILISNENNCNTVIKGITLDTKGFNTYHIDAESYNMRIQDVNLGCSNAGKKCGSNTGIIIGDNFNHAGMVLDNVFAGFMSYPVIIGSVTNQPVIITDLKTIQVNSVVYFKNPTHVYMTDSLIFGTALANGTSGTVHISTSHIQTGFLNLGSSIVKHVNTNWD